MGNNQTAVEWLESQQEIQNMINVYSCDSQLFLRMIFNKAITMEKEQIIKAFKDYHDLGHIYGLDFEDYYKETYGK
jgi:hypothetical protein